MPPVKKPTAVKRLQGTFRPDRDNINEPEIEAGKPRMPNGLPDGAKKHWRYLADQLDAMRVITPADRHALYLLSLHLWVVEEAAAELDTHGILREDRQDRLGKNPAWPVYREAAAAAKQLLREFGLTPSARQNVSPVIEIENDLFAMFLNTAQVGDE